MLRSGFIVLLAFALSSLPFRIASALEVIVISDLNGSYGSVHYNTRVGDAIERIIEMKPDLVISTGDMVAGQRRPHLSEREVRAMWRAFHREVSEPLSEAGIPFAVTPGNHDASAYGGFEREREIYTQEWSPRKPNLRFVGRNDYPFFYAFELGGVVFSSLDATTLGPLSGSQKGDLESLAKRGKPIVTFSHLPLWPFAQNRAREIIGDPELERTYSRVGVIMHLSGHHHAYYPGWKDGVAYVSQACLGGGARKLIGDSATSAHSFTSVVFDESGQFEIEAFQAPDFTTPVNQSLLPKEIQSSVARIVRLDTAR